jgi:large subunit ribosomal protein L3
MTLKLMGKKRGMTHLFDEKGNMVICTVIEMEPNVVTQVKTVEKDGYSAVQMGFEKVVTKDARTVEKRVSKPMIGHYNKAGVEPRKHLQESRMTNVEGYEVGQEIGVSAFNEVEFVDATAISIGKGFQGAMKLHNFSGMPASHGAKKNHRSLGSTGGRSTPGRCFPGGKRASHMGSKQVTIQSLRVVEVIPEENVIVVKGAVPGARNSVVTIRQAVKRTGA